ncbi:MAG: hypothetical protein Q9170_000831 [Blastenia crenularia]
MESFHLGLGISAQGRSALSKDPEKKRRKNHFNLYTAIHETESIHTNRPINPKTKQPIEPAHNFEVHLEPDSYTEEKFALFQNYQLHVHNESRSEITKGGFKRFLCSGLGQSSRLKDGVEQKLGSYHQCYRLDGRLVAVGVLDLLPGCVSSVYLIYHQDVKEWYFGKLSALREISLALEGGYQHYYMDPENYSWDSLDADYLARLSARKYVSMSRERLLQLPPRRLTEDDELEMNNVISRLPGYLHASAGDNAMRRSAFGAGMPGLMSLDEVQEKIDLGKWLVNFGKMPVHLEDLEIWAKCDIRNPSSPKRIIAELAAALGPALVSQLVLEL